MPVFLPRSLLDQFWGDSADQHGKRIGEDLDRAPPMPVAQPVPSPAPAADSGAPPSLDTWLNQIGLGGQSATPMPLAQPIQPSQSAQTAAPAYASPPPLDQFLNQLGLGSPQAPTASQPMQPAQAADATSPPPLDQFLQSVGLAPRPTPAPAAVPVPSPAQPGLAAPAAQPGQISQFGDAALSNDEAYAACGPAAAVRFAQAYGRNPTLREATDLAKTVGWSSGQGMAGLSSEKALMDKLGVSTRAVGPDWAAISNEAETGNPVTISTPGHYYFADGYNRNTGQFHVGRSGTDLKSGKEWMTAGEMEGAMGGLQGALFADNPTVQARSTAGTQAATQTTAGLSGGGASSGQVEDRGRQILDAAGDASSWLGEQGQKALQAVLVTEGGLEGARGDSGKSAGPLQFYEEGQLANFARQLGLQLDQAKAYAEQNPVQALTWAIGTATNPGYLGATLVRGIAQGLTGAALATYAQEHGQVSVSPERAGQNWNALFGAGQPVIGGGGTGGFAGPAGVAGAPTPSPTDLLQQSTDRLTQANATLESQRVESERRQREFDERQAARTKAADLSLAEAQQQGTEQYAASLAASKPSELRATPTGTIEPAATTGEQPIWDRVTTAVNDALRPILEQLGAPGAGRTAIGIPRLGQPAPTIESLQPPQPPPAAAPETEAGAGVGHLPTPLRTATGLPYNAATQAVPQTPAAEWAALAPVKPEVGAQLRGEEPTRVGPFELPGQIGGAAGYLMEPERGPGVWFARQAAGTEVLRSPELRGSDPEYAALYAEQQRLQEEANLQARTTGFGFDPESDPRAQRLFEVQERMSQIERAPGTNLQELAKANPEYEAYSTAGTIGQSLLAMPVAGEAGIGRGLAAALIDPATGLPQAGLGTLGRLVSTLRGTGLSQQAAEAAARAASEVDKFQWPDVGRAGGVFSEGPYLRQPNPAERAGDLARGVAGGVGQVAGAARGALEALPGAVRAAPGAVREALPAVAEALGNVPRPGIRAAAEAETLAPETRGAGRAAEEVPAEPGAALGPRLEPEPRTPIAEGGLGTPQYEHAAGTPEHGVATAWRDKAAADPQGIANFTPEEMSALPAQPREAGPGVPKWQEGHAVSSTDLRIAADQGMSQAQWYSKFADGVAELVGKDNINEFRSLFGITSQQTAPVDNLAYALGLMRMGREFNRDGTEFTAKNIADWTRQNPIRLGTTEGWTDSRIARWIKEGEGKRSVDADGNRYGGWGVGGAQYKKIADVFNTGQVTVGSNAKTSSYSQNILSALRNVFDPNSTMDTWMAQLFNYRDPKLVANTDAAYRSMREVVGNLAGELGMNPHQLQASMWFAIKAAKDFSRTKEAPKAYKQLVKDFTNGKASLTQVMEQARDLGVYDPERLTGTWEESIRSPQVAHQIEQLRDIIHLPSTDAAKNAYIQYPGQGKKLFPVTPTTTAERLAVAEGRAPQMSAALAPEHLAELGYDAERGQFSALGTVPHQVQLSGEQAQVMLPGGNIDTVHYAAAVTARTTGTDAVVHVFQPEAEQIAGWHLVSPDSDRLNPEHVQTVQDALDAHNVQYSATKNGIIRVGVPDGGITPDFEARLTAALDEVPGVQTEDLNGVIDRVGADESQAVIERLQSRFGAPGQSGLHGLPERGVGGPPGEPAAAGGGGALGAGAGPVRRPGEPGAAAGGQQPGPGELGQAVQRVVPGPLGRSVGLPGRPPLGGGNRPIAAATESARASRGTFGPFPVGETVAWADPATGTARSGRRLTPFDTDRIVQTRTEVRTRPPTYDPANPSASADRTAQREDWIQQLRDQGLTGRYAPPGGVGQDKTLDLVTGLPAVGKSTVIADPLQARRSAFLADNDLAKQITHEFDNGFGAGAVHEESSLMGDQVYDQALKNGENIVMPMLGKKAEKLSKQVREAKAEGYTVRLHFLDAPQEMAMGSTVQRFHGPANRFVDPLLVMDADDKPRKAFEEFMRTDGHLLDGWSHVRNEGPGRAWLVAEHNADLPPEMFAKIVSREAPADAAAAFRSGTRPEISRGPEAWAEEGARLAARPPQAAGFLAGGATGPGVVGRTVGGALAGGYQASQQEGATPEDVLRGGVQGGLLGAGRAALSRAGLRTGGLRAARAAQAIGEVAGREGPGAAAAPRISAVTNQPEIDRVLAKVGLPDAPSNDALATLTGVPSDGEVRILPHREYGEDGVAIVASHPDLEDEAVAILRAGRTHFNPEFPHLGGPQLHYEQLYLTPEARGSGRGVQMMADSVDNAEKAGIPYVDLYASGYGPKAWNPQPGNTDNGYYTWARMGFDSPLRPSDVEHFPEQWRDVKSVSELMRTPEGAAVWKEYGGSIGLHMSTDPNSPGRQVMTEYLRQKGLSGAPAEAAQAATAPRAVGPPIGHGVVGSIYDPTAANEAILDAAWQRVGPTVVRAVPAAAGAVAGYETTPEEASPLERAGRTIVGGGAAYTAGRATEAGVRAATTRGPRVAGRAFDLDELARMRRQVAEDAKWKPPPPPAANSPEYADYLAKTGDWAPPVEKGPSKADQVVAYTTANMLSGMGSAAQNLIGGVQQNVYRPIELAASGHISDAARDVQAMAAGMGEHLARFGHTFQTGQRYNQAIEAPSRGLPGGLKNPLNYPLRMLAATDEFMRSAASTGSQASEMSRLMRENPSLSFKDVLGKHQDQILEAGQKAGREATFEEGGGLLGKGGAKLAEARQKLLNSDDKGEQALGIAMQWLLPMTRVPGVIFGKGLRSVPVINEATGAVNMVRHLKAGDTRAAQREFAKTYMTTAVNLAIFDQVQQGNITGDGPDNPADRARLMEAVDAEGNPVWRPNSIKIGGRWYDHNALGPISFSMGSVANLVDEAKDYAQTPPEKRGEPPQLAADLLKRQAKTVSNAWYLRNLSDILGAVKDGNLAGFSQELVSSGDRLIPMGGLLNEIRRIEDPYAREVSKELPRGIIEREANRLPFASRTVAPRLTATTGQPVEQPRDILSTVLRGSPSGMMTPNPVAAEVSRLTEGGNRVSVPLEDDMFKGAKQSTEQLRAIRETTGHAVSQYVLDTIANPKYQGLTDQQKADALTQSVNQAKEASNVTLAGQVARSPHESALYQYATKAHYTGVSGTPEEIARKNWEISQAYAKLAEYKQKWPSSYEDRLRKDDAHAFNLTERHEQKDKETLDELKKKVDKATGGAYFDKAKQAETGGLIGAGSRVLPALPPQR